MRNEIRSAGFTLTLVSHFRASEPTDSNTNGDWSTGFRVFLDPRKVSKKSDE